jgi:hypothetical protein
MAARRGSAAGAGCLGVVRRHEAPHYALEVVRAEAVRERQRERERRPRHVVLRRRLRKRTT